MRGTLLRIPESAANAQAPLVSAVLTRFSGERQFPSVNQKTRLVWLFCATLPGKSGRLPALSIDAHKIP
jgi:hypothetical protein